MRLCLCRAEAASHQFQHFTQDLQSDDPYAPHGCVALSQNVPRLISKAAFVVTGYENIYACNVFSRCCLLSVHAACLSTFCNNTIQRKPH